MGQNANNSAIPKVEGKVFNRNWNDVVKDKDLINEIKDPTYKKLMPLEFNKMKKPFLKRVTIYENEEEDPEKVAEQLKKYLKYKTLHHLYADEDYMVQKFEWKKSDPHFKYVDLFEKIIEERERREKLLGLNGVRRPNLRDLMQIANKDVLDREEESRMLARIKKMREEGRTSLDQTSNPSENSDPAPKKVKKITGRRPHTTSLPTNFKVIRDRILL